MVTCNSWMLWKKIKTNKNIYLVGPDDSLLFFGDVTLEQGGEIVYCEESCSCPFAPCARVVFQCYEPVTRQAWSE